MHFSIRAFDDIERGDWDALYIESGTANVFYSWKFLKAAILTWEKFQGLQVIVGESNGSMRVAQPIEITETDGEVHVHFFRIIAADGIEPLGVNQMSISDVSSFIEFALSVFSARKIKAGSTSARFAKMLDAAFSGGRTKIAIKGKGTELHLPNSIDEYWSGLKSDHRNHLKRKIRKAEGAGLTFRVIELIGKGGEVAVEEALVRLTELHQKRFDSLGRSSFFVAEDLQLFHSNLAEVNGKCQSLEFIEYCHGEETVGSIYGVSSGSDYICLMTGFNPDYRDYSVGFLLVYQAVIRAIGKGQLRFDFKVGAEEYKSWWSKDKYSVYDVCVYRQSNRFLPRGRARLRAFGVRLLAAARERFTLVSESSSRRVSDCVINPKAQI